ncbi:unnamed protein product [Dracunculus medinensis]|uniref:Ral GTPase-activating protein subunit alpha/beta N-terminal domain-containing protein n=1 Tax=Dracunculus medinensis TaxID=318479 RepID=A0A3P7QHA8_DRAME|nr:unnamed protein product [Dracunculus medinensis]
MIWEEKILCALLMVFVRQQISASPEMDLVVSRQAEEIKNVLKAVSFLILNCKKEFQEFIWEICLKFLLSASDLLLVGHYNADDFGASDVIGTLLDEFLRAARYEYLPSPSYWKTLTIACRRWKHQVFKILYYKIKYLSKFVSLYGQLF